MASQGVAAANSRLTQMQMRFQQKQMQEREQRRLEMTEDSPSLSDSSVGAKSIGNGKVRQMFDERRRGAGIDRGNPLKPISSTAKALEGATRHMSGADAVSVERSHKPPPVPPKKRSSSQAPAANGYTPLTSRGKLSTSSNNNSTTQTISKGFSSLSLGDARTRSNKQVVGDRNNNNSNHNSSKSITSEDSYARAKSSNSIKLNPLVTKKSPPATKSRLSPSGGPTKPTPRTTSSSATAKQRSGRKSPDTPASATTVKTGPKRTAGTMSSHTAGGRQPPPSQNAGPPPSGMGTCRFCNRHFYTERLTKHEQICERMAHTKRKIFDAARHRIRGTEAEKYLKKNTTRSNVNVQKPSYTSAAAASGLTVSPNSALKKNNWRKKHEEFIAAIRAAKQVQAHLARGGKLSDLPPPPPSENPDYIQCPHCSRRFNQAAAERHIPRCATMIHNKPRSSQHNVATRKR